MADTVAVDQLALGDPVSADVPAPTSLPFAVADCLPDRPIREQVFVAGHEMSVISESPCGGWALVQLCPPSALASKVGPAAAVMAGPLTKHWVDDGQVTWSAVAVPAGKVSGCQVLPPSLVSIAKAGAVEWDRPRGFGPTATQWLAVLQAIDSRSTTPPVTPRGCQVAPPSSEVSTEAPTAMHRVAVGQATAPTSGALGGTVAHFQL